MQFCPRYGGSGDMLGGDYEGKRIGTSTPNNRFMSVVSRAHNYRLSLAILAVRCVDSPVIARN